MGSKLAGIDLFQRSRLHISTIAIGRPFQPPKEGTWEKDIPTLACSQPQSTLLQQAKRRKVREWTLATNDLARVES
jgi:hypothetical protein